jgi:hypothetical protein
MLRMQVLGNIKMSYMEDKTHVNNITCTRKSPLPQGIQEYILQSNDQELRQKQPAIFEETRITEWDMKIMKVNRKKHLKSENQDPDKMTGKGKKEQERGRTEMDL